MPFGIGNNLLGGSGSEISASLQSRRFGDAVSPLSQVSMGSPRSGMSTMPIPASQLPSTPVPVGQLKQPPQDESSMIVKALIERLKSIGKTSVTQF